MDGWRGLKQLFMDCELVAVLPLSHIEPRHHEHAESACVADTVIIRYCVSLNIQLLIQNYYEMIGYCYKLIIETRFAIPQQCHNIRLSLLSNPIPSDPAGAFCLMMATISEAEEGGEFGLFLSLFRSLVPFYPLLTS